MDDPLLTVKKYLAAIGRRGGAKSKRKLSKREARRIASAGWEGAVGEARRAKLRAKTHNNEERLRKAIELLESAIMDFEKLKPWLGDATLATAQLYRDELAKIQCSLN